LDSVDIVLLQFSIGAYVNIFKVKQRICQIVDYVLLLKERQFSSEYKIKFVLIFADLVHFFVFTIAHNLKFIIKFSNIFLSVIFYKFLKQWVSIKNVAEQQLVFPIFLAFRNDGGQNLEG